MVASVALNTRFTTFLRRAYHWRYTPAAVREARRLGLRRRRLAQLPPPVTFNEKVRYKMLADRRRLLTTFADKLAVRRYVESKVGGNILTELYAVTESPRTLLREDLPREFVAKATHGSGACILVGDCFNADSRLPKVPAGWAAPAGVSPEWLDWDHLMCLAEEWLTLRYYEDEWAYRNIRPRVLFEELLVDRGGVPNDLKFFVFHGRARLVQVNIGRFESETRSLYTPDWERIHVRYGKPPGIAIPEPTNLSEMLVIAETLG